MSIGIIAFLIGILVFLIGTTLTSTALIPKALNLEKRLPNTQDQEIYEILNDIRYSDTKFGRFHKSYIKPQYIKHPNAQQHLSKLLSVNMDKLDKEILEAGLQDRFTVEEVLSLRLLGVVSMIVFITMGAMLNFNTPLIILGVVAYLLGAFIPKNMIDKNIKERREAIEYMLPEFLDLLKSVTEAGLVIQEAINKVATRLKGPLAEEFRAVMVETKASGGQWRLAMENMAFRNDIDSLSDVVSDILITYEKGTSITETLQKEAQTMRQLKNMKTQEKARSLSIKLIIPMVIFNFLPLIILLAGPMTISLIESLG